MHYYELIPWTLYILLTFHMHVKEGKKIYKIPQNRMATGVSYIRKLDHFKLKLKFNHQTPGYPRTHSLTLINSTMPSGREVLLSRRKYSMMSLVCSPTETAAYSEYAVNLYSWMCSGLHTGWKVKCFVLVWYYIHNHLTVTLLL